MNDYTKKSGDTPKDKMDIDELTKISKNLLTSLDKKSVTGTTINTNSPVITTGGVVGYPNIGDPNGFWDTTGPHTYSVYNEVSVFSPARFSRNIAQSGLGPFELMLETYKLHTPDAFFDAFMYACELKIIDKHIFDVFVFEKKVHELYSACPEFQTMEGTIDVIAELKSPSIVAYLRQDIRENAEIKREINVMKLKGYFD